MSESTTSEIQVNDDWKLTVESKHLMSYNEKLKICIRLCDWSVGTFPKERVVEILRRQEPQTTEVKVFFNIPLPQITT